MGIDLLQYADNLSAELQNEGISFNEYGFPVFPEEIILKEIPDDIGLCPMTQRLQISDAEKQILCHYENDSRIFQHIANLEKMAYEGKKFYGVAGLDLSPRTGLDPDYQKLIILINQLATIRLGLYGCRIAPNFRIGSITTIIALKSYPENIPFVSGVLGCFNGDIKFNMAYMKAKIMFAKPQSLIIYGQLRKEYRMVLDELGIKYRIVEDFQRRSRTETKKLKEYSYGCQN